ncbi:uncharacterized protein [Amphiura filiformis]|uniref:uncharacterized protein n=1 Tax=Amphiura filiformis TaxID=82378 RepID=UPI003B21329A
MHALHMDGSLWVILVLPAIAFGRLQTSNRSSQRSSAIKLPSVIHHGRNHEHQNRVSHQREKRAGQNNGFSQLSEQELNELMTLFAAYGIFIPTTTPSEVTTQSACNDDEFLCTYSSDCIPIEQRCDGKFQCPMAEDEEQCDSHRCISGWRKCDNNRQCVQKTWSCDGYVDCFDGSDERRCDEQRCPLPTMRKCSKFPQCYDGNYRCDAVTDCRDGSDEQNCENHVCRDGWTKCNNGFQCVDVNWLCDGTVYCTDGSDEWGCNDKDMKPTKTELRLQASFNERYNHPDWQLCTGSYTLPCRDGKKCYLDMGQCDGIRACEDGSDEERCDHFTCQTGKIKCEDNHQCIWFEWLCDGVIHCKDRSDEVGCAVYNPEHRNGTSSTSTTFGNP